jgi:hypothetical protein
MGEMTLYIYVFFVHCICDFATGVFQFHSRPARGGQGGCKLPEARSAQRGPEISVLVRIVHHRFMFVLNEIRLLAHYPLIVVIDRKTYQM